MITTTIMLGFGAAWILLMGGIFAAVAVSKRAGQVLVTGFDDSSGDVATRRLKPNREGVVNWKKGKDPACSIQLDYTYSRPDSDRRIPHFIADVTPGQGRLVKRNPSHDGPPPDNERLLEKPKETSWTPMPGDRALVLIGATHVKEINRSNSMDIGKILMIGGAIIGMILILVIIALVVLVKVARQTGAV